MDFDLFTKSLEVYKNTMEFAPNISLLNRVVKSTNDCSKHLKGLRYVYLRDFKLITTPITRKTEFNLIFVFAGGLNDNRDEDIIKEYIMPEFKKYGVSYTIENNIEQVEPSESRLLLWSKYGIEYILNDASVIKNYLLPKEFVTLDSDIYFTADLNGLTILIGCEDCLSRDSQILESIGYTSIFNENTDGKKFWCILSTNVFLQSELPIVSIEKFSEVMLQLYDSMENQHNHTIM